MDNSKMEYFGAGHIIAQERLNEQTLYAETAFKPEAHTEEELNTFLAIARNMQLPLHLFERNSKENLSYRIELSKFQDEEHFDQVVPYRGGDKGIIW